ncbi:MAG TPA: hypothetical protein VMG12_06355 [Polyangiaceae bacterium]|nr:hypothetical protein [Polyangiaceae bacterium]
MLETRRGARWLWLLLVGCAGEDAADEPCLVLSSSYLPDALQPSPSSSCGEPVFGAEALAELDAFAAAIDARWCELAVRCGLHVDVPSCELTGPSLPLARVRAGIEAGRTGAVRRAAQAIVGWLGPSEGCTLQGSSQLLETAMQLAFPGRGRAGDACWVTTDCAGPARCDGSACDGSSACCSGVCIAYRRGVAEGERCDIDECGPGLACYRVVAPEPATSDEFYTCHPALSENAECTDTYGVHCEAGTSCRLDPMGVSRCRVGPPELGESCARNGGFDGCRALDVGCHDGSVCSARQPIGASCASDEDCLQRAACVEGECVARLALGAACQWPPDLCGYGLRCNQQSGVCERPAEPAACGP